MGPRLRKPRAAGAHAPELVRQRIAAFRLRTCPARLRPCSAANFVLDGRSTTYHSRSPPFALSTGVEYRAATDFLGYTAIGRPGPARSARRAPARLAYSRP